MCKYDRIARSQLQNARSDRLHLAILLSGNRVISIGQNDYKRNLFCGMNVPSVHAEMAAANKLMTKSEKRVVGCNCNLKRRADLGVLSRDQLTTFHRIKPPRVQRNSAKEEKVEKVDYARCECIVSRRRIY